MILVSVTNPGDVQLTRALFKILGSRFEWFILFASNELRAMMGELDCKYGFDLPLCILNAPKFDLVVSFAGLLHPGMMSNLHLLSFFNELGVATVEVQHGLFQYGINHVDLGRQVGTNNERGDQLGIDIGYAARTVIPWAGSGGIGYPKSVLTPMPHTHGHGFALITSNNHWQIYEARHRRQFADAVTTIATSHPSQEFVWKPHFGEYVHSATRHVLEAVAEKKLPNLHVERAGNAEDLIPSCSFAVSTVSTTLLDYQLHRKPVVVFDCEPVRHLIERLRVQTFCDANDLAAKLAHLPAEPEAYQVQTGVEPFMPERLAERFEQALGVTKPLRDHLPIALRYLNYLGALQASREQSKFEHVVADVKQDLARIEATIARKVAQTAENTYQGIARMESTIAGEAARAAQDLATNLSAKVSDIAIGTEQTLHKVGVLQRSTLAYKLKKLRKNLRGQ